jgi:pyrroloquinoline quinone biosynthesis protein B
MRLRVQGAATPRQNTQQGAPNGAPCLMLSPGHGGHSGHGGHGAWCRVDAGRVAAGDDGAAVVLTGMQREQVGGLLDLRNGAPIDLYATPSVFEHLTHALPLLPVLQQFCGVQWHLIPVAGEQRTADFSVETLPELVFTALTTGDAAGERVALAVRDERSGARLFIADGASLDSAAFDSMRDWMQDADCVVIDRAPHAAAGTRWRDRLAQLPSARKLLLDANGADRAAFAACGIECAQGAMEFEL